MAWAEKTPKHNFSSIKEKIIWETREKLIQPKCLDYDHNASMPHECPTLCQT